MSYQVLARKWRPKSFQELMGQEHVVTVLTNALNQERLHHAYLFTGTRGVGKTTIARIFAKSLNCEQGVTSTPCGTCDTCTDIDQGRYVDLLEIDAASRTKVDDTREILDNVQYAPSRGRYKVYLIDEVHMLSRSSFNALLKTLEEPPEHVKFILATTDPQKLPITVLSRCLQFHLKALTVKQIEQKLHEILVAENVSYQPSAVTLLAKAARGSMRDSLSLTDQAIAQGENNIEIANVQEMLGGVDQNWVYNILIALIKQDSHALMEQSLTIASYAPNYSRLLAELIQLLHQIAMSQVVTQHFDLLPEHNHLLEKFSQAMTPEDVQLYYQIVLNGRKDLPYASDEQAAFDMVLLRLLAFKPMSVSDATNEKNNVNQNEFHAEALENTAPKQHSQNTSINSSEVITENNNIPVTPVEQDENVNDTSEETSHLTQELVSIELSASEQGFERNEAASFNTPNNDVISPQVEKTEPPLPEIHLPHEQPQNNETLETIAPAIEETPATIASTSQVESALATRNMLRSRRKNMEAAPKKSKGTEISPQTNNSNTDVTSSEHSELPEKPVAPPINISDVVEKKFTPETIDPAIVRSAKQVDEWARMIDSMALVGITKQLAIHATICQSSTADKLVLQMDQSISHLNSESAHKKLEAHMCEYLGRSVTVELNIVAETVADPFQIQSQINDKRYEYAKNVLKEDTVVNALETQFQATLDEETIVAE